MNAMNLRSLRWPLGEPAGTSLPAVPAVPALPDLATDLAGSSAARDADDRARRDGPQELAVRTRLAHGTLALPLRGDLAASAQRVVRRGDASIAEVHALAALDVGLAARFLAAAAEIGGARPVRSIAEAIDRLGPRAARELLSRAVHAATPPPRRFAREIEASTWRAPRCAAAAEELARRLELAIDGAYLVGLLHDVGVLRVWRVVAESEDVETAEDARRLVRCLHEEAGADLARAWRLPSSVEEACAAHHGTSSARTPVQRLAAASSAIVDAAARGLSPARLDVLAAIGVAPSLARELAARLSPGRHRQE